MTKRNTPAIPVTTPVGRVYDFILRSGAAGVTDEDIFLTLAQSTTERADRHRRAALVRDGLVVDSGVRRLTSNNRPATVWKAKRSVKTNTQKTASRAR